MRRMPYKATCRLLRGLKDGVTGVSVCGADVGKDVSNGPREAWLAVCYKVLVLRESCAVVT